METTVHRLRYVLDVLEPAVAGKKATLPILKNVVIGQGRAYATNLEAAITVEMPEATGAPLLLPHSQLLSLLKHIPAGTRLTINREGQAIKLAAGATTAEFPVPGEVADFPPLPVLQPIGEGQVDGDLFLKTATALAEYAATDASRPVLQCVCIALGDPIEMVGADGFRLAWQTIPVALPAPNGALKQLLLPTAAVGTMARVWKLMEKQPSVDAQSASGGSDPLNKDGSFRMAMLAVAKRMATIRFSPAALSFHHGAVTILVRLTEGQFPDYHQLIPTDLPHKVTFDAEAALRAIKSLADIAADGSGIVRLQWSTDRLVFSGQAQEVGSITTSVPAHSQDGEGRIAFNIRYLLDHLGGKLGMVLLETSGPKAPGRFFCSGSPDVLLMPVFVQWEESPTTEQAADQPTGAEAAEEPTGDQHAPVDEGTPEAPAASPPTRSKKPRRGK
jgi:DNA polymerase III sliding clamp (beta) subunit (PCNA family)